MNLWRPCQAAEEHFLLLQAALLAGSPALQAWPLWKSRVDLGSVDAPSFALLPFLHRNLRALGVEDANMGRLAGVARSTWASNHLLYRAGADALAILRGAGVDALVADGAAVSVLHHEEAGLRRLSNFDALVRLADAAKAIDALSAAGWRMETLRSPRDSMIAFRDAARFEDGRGQSLRLIWRLWAGDAADAETKTWAASHEGTLENLSVRALGPTDLLLRACAGTERWGRELSLLWVADGLAILRGAGGEIDWERFTKRARRLGLSLPAASALDCLRTAFGASVPAGIVEVLREAPTSMWERAAWRTQAQRRGGWPRLAVTLRRYDRLTRGQGIARRAIAFPRYLRCTWNLQSAWQTPVHAARRVAQEMRRAAIGK